MQEKEVLSKYIVVQSSVLPEVLKKVIHAKKLLASKQAKTSSEAAKMMDLSRSAFYKYKDKVFEYSAINADNIVTLALLLSDYAGILSSIISYISSSGGDILTINQNIPVDNVALVSISIRTNHMEGDTEALLYELLKIKGVIEVKLV